MGSAALREIDRYVSGAIDLWDLDDWLNTPVLNISHDDPAFPLSREVFLLMAELTSGHRTEDDVRARLRAAAVDTNDAAQIKPTTSLVG